MPAESEASDNGVVNGGPSLPSAVREAMKSPKNVCGAEFLPPQDLDGYLDEPVAKFGLWVGETPDEAELLTFEISGNQIENLANAFGRQADDARALAKSNDQK